MKALPASFALAAVLAWAGSARAEPSYPGDVDMALGSTSMLVETKMDPPMGCQLCHTSPAGGTLTLSPFGNFMVADYGLPKVNALEDNQVAQAFARLEAAEPKLWADMKAGVDPNSDPTFTESAPPQPQYGCAASKVPTGPGSSWPTALGLAALAVTLRRRRSR